MTALGKILVFFNLLFALVTGGMIVQVYLTRTNWKTGYDAAVADRDAMQAALKGEQSVQRFNKDAFDRKLAELDSQIKDLQGLVNAARADADNAKGLKAASDRVAKTLNVNMQAASNEIDKLKTERDQMQVQLNQKNERIAKLESDNANITAKSTYNGIRADLTEKEIQDKKVELADLTRQVGEMKAELQRLGAVRDRAVANKPRVPSVDETGKVQSVAGDIAVISLGSDHGLEPGHILQVYRTNPAPQYLGTLVVQRAETHRAVGVFQPVGRNAVVKVGDSVNTKIQ